MQAEQRKTRSTNEDAQIAAAAPGDGDAEIAKQRKVSCEDTHPDLPALQSAKLNAKEADDLRDIRRDGSN